MEIINDSDLNNDVFLKNEIQANKFCGITEIVLSAAVIAAWALIELIGQYEMPLFFHIWVILSVITMIVGVVLIRYFNGKAPWLKYVLEFFLICIAGMLFYFLGVSASLIVALPVLVSSRYYSVRFIWIISAACFVMMLVAAYFATIPGTQSYVLMNIVIPAKELVIAAGQDPYYALLEAGIDWNAYKVQFFTVALFPIYFMLILFDYIAVLVAKAGMNMVKAQAEISANEARIESELNMATKIQSDLLPSVFPPFPDRREFDIYATMTPAKEVGGDLYDFFMVDDTHLAVIVADVSGKGIPAALFMVTAKNLIKSQSKLGYTADKIFYNANNSLCDGNESGLFVTGWIGILDTETGEFEFVNAGHNPPLVMQPGEDFAYLKSEANLVLALMEDMPYTKHKIVLKPGARLYMYTDGITEAVNTDNDQYGEDRLAAYLNHHKEDGLKDTLVGLRNNIDCFAGDAEQFDDMTMLILEYKGN